MNIDEERKAFEAKMGLHSHPTKTEKVAIQMKFGACVGQHGKPALCQCGEELRLRCGGEMAQRGQLLPGKATTTMEEGRKRIAEMAAILTRKVVA